MYVCMYTQTMYLCYPINLDIFLEIMHDRQNGTEHAVISRQMGVGKAGVGEMAPLHLLQGVTWEC